MLNQVTTALALSFAITSATEQAGYSQPTAYAAPAPYQPYTAPAAASDYGSYYGHGYYRRFPAPRPVMDPKYYQTVLSGFQQCVNHKCQSLPRTYTSTPKESLAAVADYTACVTSCASSEMMRVVIDLKGLLAKIYDIGSSHLASSHRYLAGEEEYDVLGNNTHIEESCCLPTDYFAAWEKIVFVSNFRFPNHRNNFKRLISVKEYLDYCSERKDGQLYLGKFRLNCNLKWMKYLRQMQLNLGHLILAPKCKTLAPDDACTKDLQHNPRAEEFGQDVCVAYECVEEGKKQLLTVPIIKYPVESLTYAGSCPEDSHGDVTLRYRRVPAKHVEFYTLTTGLPSSKPVELDNLVDVEWTNYNDGCEYEQGLVKRDDDGKFSILPPPATPEAAELCPVSGLFEYCHIKQYVNFLQKQLFDFSGCPVVDMGRAEGDGDVMPDSPYAYYTLACLYRVVSLKCDCMEAVLNCYEHEYHFSTSIGKTLGKAASVMCGFILCQKPSVYYLLGGEDAIENSKILRSVLMQVGAIQANPSLFTPATVAFLSFGLGMIAFVVTKAATKVTRKSVVGVEDGYSNLI